MTAEAKDLRRCFCDLFSARTHATRLALHHSTNAPTTNDQRRFWIPALAVLWVAVAQYCVLGGGVLWRNIVSRDIRIETMRERDQVRGRVRLRRNETTHLGRGRSTCRELGLSHAVHSAGLCCRVRRAAGNVRNAVLSCIRASNACISTREAGSNACSRSKNVSRRKMPATIVRCTKFALLEKKRLPPLPASGPAMRGRPLRIFSRNRKLRTSDFRPRPEWFVPRSEVQGLRSAFRAFALVSVGPRS